MAFNTYDPAAVVMIYGSHIIEGFADDSMITVEAIEDDWVLSVGADGESVRSKVNNSSATVTISLKHTSASNGKFEEQRRLDQLKNAGAAPLLIRDPATGTVHEAAAAYVKRNPTRNYNREAQDVEWILEVPELKTQHNLNNAVDSLVG